LAADVVLTTPLNLAEGVTLNGNGNKIERKSEVALAGAGIVGAYKNATIKNVEFSAPKAQYDVYVMGEDVTIEGCTFNTPCDASAAFSKRAIEFSKASGDLKVKNCDIDVCGLTNNKRGYALNAQSTNIIDVNLLVEGGTMTGWMSFAPVNSAKFDGVSFYAKTGLTSGINPYSVTVFEECIFNAPFTINKGSQPALTHYLNKCTLNGYDSMLDLVTNDGDGDGQEMYLVVDGLEYKFVNKANSGTSEE